MKKARPNTVPEKKTGPGKPREKEKPNLFSDVLIIIFRNSSGRKLRKRKKVYQ